MGIIRNRGIAFKLVFFILTSCTLIFLVIFGYNYLVSRRIIVRNIQDSAQNLALVTVNKIETVLRAVEKVPQNLAYSLEESQYRKKGLMNLLRSVVENNPEIYGATIAFEPYAFDKDSLYFAPYFYKSDGEIKYANLGEESYDYFSWDWYRAPKERDRPLWSEPYFDVGGGNVIMSTYSVPFYREVDGKKTFMGIVTADISLSWLQDLVASIKIGETGYGFLVSKEGKVVTHPKKELIMNETLFSLADARGDTALSEIGRCMIRGDSGFVPCESIVTGKKSWMVYAPIPSTGWSLGVLYPQDELMADVTHLSRVVLVLALVGFAFLLAVIVSISGSITRPLRTLARTTKDIADGNLDFTLPRVGSGDEVGKLSDSFLYMRDSLKRHIRELTETTAAKERMESELKIAHDIQMGIVPKIFPPFPDVPEFDIYAVLDPAREVGGDFFDFFLIDERLLCFVIADVSGKGVPASLFMAVTKTLINVIAREIRDPAEILDRVNKEISSDNPSFIFVTVFCGILDIRTGEVCYSNGGHNPPLLIRRGKGVEFLTGGGGTIVGISREIEYTRAMLRLEPGDTICMYTDGVTEAFNEDREQFSEERLEKEVASRRGDSIKGLVKGILETIRSFAGGAPQSDDITIMALRYFGSDGGEAGNREANDGLKSKVSS